MRVVVQRVAWAKVEVDGVTVGECGPGFLAFVGAGKDDTEASADRAADRVAGLRVMADDSGKMNLSLAAVRATEGNQVLAVSNFTLYGDTSQRRPNFVQAAAAEDGKRLFDHFVEALRSTGLRVATGVFGADMQVTAQGDGPVTILIEVE
ncbi:MAG: D-aminoacyl-tRNA deacylase [Fimbriimonadaceae bacterium]